MTSTLYFDLKSENCLQENLDFVAIYTGEMTSLEYPTITNAANPNFYTLIFKIMFTN